MKSVQLKHFPPPARPKEAISPRATFAKLSMLPYQDISSRTGASMIATRSVLSLCRGCGLPLSHNSDYLKGKTREPTVVLGFKSSVPTQQNYRASRDFWPPVSCHIIKPRNAVLTAQSFTAVSARLFWFEPWTQKKHVLYVLRRRKNVLRVRVVVLGRFCFHAGKRMNLQKRQAR